MILTHADWAMCAICGPLSDLTSSRPFPGSIFTEQGNRLKIGGLIADVAAIHDSPCGNANTQILG